MGTSTARNARAEAQAKLGDGGVARVLEPSPPAVLDGPFFADDPVATDDAPSGATVVVPSGVPGVRDWSTVVGESPAIADWAASHWLGGFRHLPATPAGLTATRLALHRLGAYVIAPARHAANGKFGLRWTAGGFGTPFFRTPGDDRDRQVRVEGTTLVDQVGDEVRTSPITTLQAAAGFLGVEVDPTTAAEHDSPPVGDVDETLAVDEDASRFLGHWFGMGFAALEALRADGTSVDPARPQLWPGHFDPAIEVGDEDHRGSYGASPGDHAIDEPYLYVAPWYPDKTSLDPADPAWNAPSFTGAILRLSDFPAGADAVATAVEFYTSHRDRLG
ncbi:MAG: hypothetical protein AAF547_13790 [Actinomycetota bacterium]